MHSTSSNSVLAIASIGKLCLPSFNPPRRSQFECFSLSAQCCTEVSTCQSARFLEGAPLVP
eukprot:5216091-Amphidinium_carterae.1